MQTRCFMPPLSSCGYMRTTRDGRSTDSRSSTMRARNSRVRRPSCARIASASCAPTRSTGLSAFIAPCGTSEIDCQRSRRRSSGRSARRSTPSSSTRPLSIRPGGLISPRIAIAVVLLPLPDSPTSPRISPRRRSRPRSETAVKRPRAVS
jgi:hypothetical protein